MMIRRATKKDIDAMIPMLGELFSIETDFVTNAGKQLAGLSFLFAGKSKSVIFVAEDDDGNIAGMVTVQLVVSTAVGGYGALLEDVIVREKYRRRKIGTALLDAVKSWAADKGAKRIQLLADQRNRPALVFYAGKGFLESSMRGFYLNIQE